ncbi:MAG TPA: aminotransferase class IV [Myxococcota bacterium]
MLQRDAAKIDRTLWIDGSFVPWGEATTHVLSHSHQRGSLIFDFLRVVNADRGPALFRLREHVERLQRSAELMGLPLEQDADALCAATVATVARNPGATDVKISAYFPSIEVDVVPVDDHVSVAIAAYDPIADILAHKATAPRPRPDTLRLWVEKDLQNRRKEIITPQAKVAANSASPMLAKWRARAAGYDEVLLTDAQGSVAEGPTTNVFLVDAAGALITPPAEGVLHGVTRRSILEVATHDGLTVREARVRPEDLIAAAELFLCGTSSFVWPVASVDDQPIGTEVPGPVTRRLRERLLEISAGRDPVFEHWLTYVE